MDFGDSSKRFRLLSVVENNGVFGCHCKNHPVWQCEQGLELGPRLIFFDLNSVLSGNRPQIVFNRTKPDGNTYFFPRQIQDGPEKQMVQATLALSRAFSGLLGKISSSENVGAVLDIRFPIHLKNT